MKWRYVGTPDRAIVLADGTIHVTPAASLIASSGLSNGASAHLTLVYDYILGRVVVDGLQIEREGSGTEIHTSLLHEVHLTTALRNAVLNNMIQVAKPPSKKLRPASDALDSYAPAQGRRRDEVLRDAATIYTIAKIANLPPLKTVAEQLDISHRTASRRVATVRKYGWLGDPTFVTTDHEA